MQQVRHIAPYRVLITRAVLLYYVLFILLRWYSHLLPAQLLDPSLTKMHYDLSFWLFRLSGLDGALVHNAIGTALFSIAIVGLCILSLLFPLRRGFIISFSLVYFLMALTSNIYLCHSAHYLGCMVWLSVAFWASSDDNFDLMWEGMRYYCCWIYASAFIWKVVNGSFFQWDAGILTFKMNLAEYLYHNPDTAMAHFYYYFIQHPLFVNIGHKIVALAEGLFIIGFFTKKYDKILIITALLIFVSLYIFSDVFFAELLALIFPLVSINGWKKLAGKLPPALPRRTIAKD